METRPPLPPFTIETAAQKVRMAEDAWNSRDPARVVRETHQTVFMITHDVDEAILLADRILLMSNGTETVAGYRPGGIAEVVHNTLPKSRKRAALHHLPGYYELRNHIVDFLVTRALAGADH